MGIEVKELGRVVLYVTHLEMVAAFYRDTYILDPDGNEIELYADVSDGWKKDPVSILTQTKPLKIKE